MLKTAESPSCVTCSVKCASVFNVLQETDLAELDKLKEYSGYRKGEYIFSEGKRPRGIYVLHSGKVKVFKLDENGREQIVRMARPGDVLGYRSLISNEVYSAFAEAIEDCGVCFIPKDSLLALFDKHSTLSMNFMKLLGKDLALAEKKVLRMIYHPVRERIAEALLMLKDLYGTLDDGKTLNVKISREDMANMAGTTTESAIRTLAELRDDGIIELDKKRIILSRPEKLQQECGCND